MSNASAVPCLLSTWTFGQRSNAAGWPLLAAGGDALDAVEAVARRAEDDDTITSVGYGGLPDRAGDVSLDAAIMVSPARHGAVANLRGCRHAISVARRVMEDGACALVVGAQADAFARSHGFIDESLLAPGALEAWQHWRAAQFGASARAGDARGHDTIGTLALDVRGRLAASCTTSGLAWKPPGRVGDSPLVGHGLYVDYFDRARTRGAAAVMTGRGELVMGVCGAFLAVECVRHGATPAAAARAVIERVVATQADIITPDDELGAIVLDAQGRWGSAALRDGFVVARRDEAVDALCPPDYVWRADVAAGG